MVNQTSMTKANGRETSSGNLVGDRSPENTTAQSGANAVVSNVAGFGEDLLNLSELQARLTAVEVRQNLDVVKTGGALIATGVIIGMAALPVGLIGIADLLVSEMGLKRGFALLGVATVAILVAGSCVGLAASWFRRKPLGFPLSGEELARNVNWVRTVLRQSGRLSFRR
jgi:Putative Actinobacterial Holin-X, holin superfamily III